MSPRTIVVDGQEYRWSRRAGRERLSVWVDEHRRAILQIHFESLSDGPNPDFAESISRWADGTVESGLWSYNLNRPAMVAALIREARSRGWDPLGRRSLTLDGFALLRERARTFPHEPIHDAWVLFAAQLIERGASEDDRPPLAWLRERTGRSWPLVGLQPQQIALALAGLLEHGVLLERPDDLTPTQLGEATVWADARQAQGQAGGLVLASWLTGGSSFGERELDDLRRWCEALLSDPRSPSASSNAK